MTSAPEPDRTDARLAQLQRAAYRRGASDEDRAALAAYERSRPAAAGATADRMPRRRFPWLVATSLLLGVVLGAGGTAWGGGLLRGDAFDRFTAPLDDPEAVAEVAAMLAQQSVQTGMVYIGGDAVLGTLEAGPVPLHSSHGVDLYGALVAPVDGEQQVCIAPVHDDEGQTLLACVPRSQFEEHGIAHRFARDDELNAILELVWRADDSVTIREADLSAIG